MYILKESPAGMHQQPVMMFPSFILTRSLLMLASSGRPLFQTRLGAVGHKRGRLEGAEAAGRAAVAALAGGDVGFHRASACDRDGPRDARFVHAFCTSRVKLAEVIRVMKKAARESSSEPGALQRGLLRHSQVGGAVA